MQVQSSCFVSKTKILVLEAHLVLYFLLKREKYLLPRRKRRIYTNIIVFLIVHKYLILYPLRYRFSPCATLVAKYPILIL